MTESYGYEANSKAYIDAQDVRNVAAFINHACKPSTAPGQPEGPDSGHNAEVWFKVTVFHQDRDRNHLGVFATRDIEAQEEILISYGKKPHAHCKCMKCLTRPDRHHERSTLR